MVLRSICGIYKPVQENYVKKYHPRAERANFGLLEF